MYRRCPEEKWLLLRRRWRRRLLLLLRSLVIHFLHGSIRRIVKLVRAIRKGWLKTNEQKRKARVPDQQPLYLIWADDNQASDKTGVGLSYIPPSKPKLPGHGESYNPPAEYLPTEEERQAWEVRLNLFLVGYRYDRH